MEFVYFGVHSRGLMGRMIIGHLDLAGDEIKNTNVNFPDFVKDKHTYGGAFGQLPALKMPDGELRGQNGAIARFLAKKYKTKTGGCLYPSHADAMTSYWIDSWIDKQDEIFKQYGKFTIPLFDAYKEKDKHFLEFITKWLPNFLSTIESTLEKNDTKWLAGNEISLADFAIGCHIVRLAYNHRYENQHIIRAVIAKNPKTQAWAEQFRDHTAEWFSNNNSYEAPF